MASTGFFHGIEIKDVDSGDIIITQRGAGTIALPGVSPVGPAGMSLVNNDVDASVFGPSIFDGRTIPHALDVILAQGVAQVIVINCYDPTKHNAAVTAESNNVSAGLTITLAHIPVSAPVIKTSDGATTLVAGVDYLWTPNTTKIKILNPTTYPATTTLKAAYSWFNSTLVVAADIVGGITSGVRSGIALLDLCYANFGILPKILIAPGFSTTQTVTDALLGQADKLRARVIIDAPEGTTIPGAIALRGGSSNFNTSNGRALGVFPEIYKPDTFGGGSDVLFPQSAYMAGVWANTVNTLGIQYSPSNKLINGASKTETPISCNIGDATSDASNLNAAGICTLMTGFATGIKTWGNRSFKFPNAASIDVFLSVQLVRDVLDESVQLAAIAFSDLPLNLAFIDTVKESVNGFINTLILSGALIDGSCTYNPAKNPPALLAQGKVTFSMNYLPPGPAEDIAFESFIDINLFSKLNQ